jgi:starvation-inducible DNA-binding protein
MSAAPAIDIGIPAQQYAPSDVHGAVHRAIPETDGVPAAMDMVSELVAGHEAVAGTIRSVFAVADEANDQPTADLLTQRLQIHEKTAWMLRSLLEG